MTDQDRWELQNEAYLSAALHWIRLRLYQLAGPADAAPDETLPPPPEPGLRERLLGRRPPPRALLAPGGTAVDTELEQAEAAMVEAGSLDPPPALHILARRFGLSEFEQNALLLCAALELDTRIAGLCARAQHDSTRPYPTFALIVALFDDPAWDVLSPERPLRYWRLIEINQPGAEPLITSALRADERIVSYIKGLNYLDDRLTPLLIPFDAGIDGSLPPSQLAAASAIERAVRQSMSNGEPPIVQLVGIDPLSKQLVAQQAARALQLNLYRMPVELVPQQPAELETVARLWQRESILLSIALFLDAHQQDGEQKGEGTAPDASKPLHRFLARSRGPFLVSSRELRADLGPVVQAIEVDKPLAAEQQAAWAVMLEGHAAGSPALLAGQFNLNTTAIQQIARSALDVQDESAAGPLHERLWDACLAGTGPQMDRLAQRLRPVATWADIVLPDDELSLLRQLAGQVDRRATVYDRWGFRERMNRGLGISALFTGESGTGKTMAAEVIANDLRLNLYRIDLSAVVSKYIGETEKNLRRVFDAAEDGGAILFFDEADALFGKRSEVRDSHDRYANIEINYLLQRIEAYRGLAILATNMKSALDKAFMRRLRFVVAFPFPGKPQRRDIWQRAWPADTPTRALDFDHLARFNLTGGSIANIALNAAFLAAERGTPVTMPLVLAATRTELRKLERPYNDAHLRWVDPERPDDVRSSKSPDGSPTDPQRGTAA
jgi:SpoVK/Ycf46/Vps4 family AAA+-type ATPase